ncbi:MAG: alanine--tRNA ligase-related protein [Patescibacteria group bacterium]
MVKTLTGAEVRQKFIDYYKSLGHVEIPSSPLVLKDDPTTLFTGSGMQQIVPYLLGQPHPLGKRLVDVQQCFRTEDLEEVGDGWHQTLFEMLGCWSLGDYFKAEQIPWTFGFFVDELGIDPHKLYVTTLAGGHGIPRDDETVAIWKEVFAKYGIKAESTDDIYKVGGGNYRIFCYPWKVGKSWWERSRAPVGDPAGPTTEIFFFTGNDHDKKFGEYCHVNCDCGRYIEIGNDVFMQYRKVSQADYEPLVQKNVDCGWGLDRIVRVVQNKKSNFETDLFHPIIQKIESMSTTKYGDGAVTDWVYRIDADHIRASVFLIADGVTPSNKMQGYVLRRLLRRIIFQSRKLGIPQNSLADVAKVVIDKYGDYYKHLQNARDKIIAEISAEEEKFNKTLEKGLKEMEKMYEKNGQKLNDGQLENLYQTYGVPKELSQEICKERGWILVRHEVSHRTK